MREVVVVGASLAGLRAAETLRRQGFDGTVTLVGDEAHPPYDRPPLSKGFAGGTVGREQIHLRQSAELSATWLLGRRAVGLDTGRREVRLDGGETLGYDGLVVATGATPRRLPGLPEHLPGLHLLRTVDDALALRDELRPGARVVIVGGGFIGAELASTCRDLGLPVTVVTPLPLMVSALGPLSSAAAKRARRHGVDLIEGIAVTGVDADERVRGVRLADGGVIPADVVVVAVGVVPATDWLAGSGVELENGVVCDETLAVRGVDDVVAAGDVARWPHPALGGGLLRLEHWTNAAEQAAAAAGRLLRGSGPRFAPVPSFWSDQFGVRLQGIGLPGLADEATVVDGDASGEHFVAEYRRGGELIGALCAGTVKPLLPYRRQLVGAFA
ncbi:FAD-dependent oxidoreductase [Rugosimonospora acidiphila]|uniref:FAD-dependent oxidoreductase n=2 Tax=Rugosimonospora acidiphila TaxID=556531 RepID=A0ABP9S206_9ACTN